MQRIKSHPSGANNRYSIPHCTRPQETKTGSLPRIIFEGVAKPTGCGVCLPEAGAAGPGPGMRRLLVRSEDVIDVGVSQIKLRIAWPAYPNHVVVVTVAAQSPRGPLTRGQLLSTVANEYMKYFEHLSREKENLKGLVPPTFADFDIVVKPKFRLSNICIISLVHIGPNTWQADVELEL